MTTYATRQLIHFLPVASLLLSLTHSLQAQVPVEGSRSLADDERPRIMSLTNRASGITHLKGQRFIDLAVGTMDHVSAHPFATDNAGIGIHLATGKYRQSLSAWRVMASFGRKLIFSDVTGSIVRIPYALYTVGYGYEFNLARSADRQRFVRAEFSALSLYESINNDSKVVTHDNQVYDLAAGSRFGLGVDGALSVELSHVALGLRQRWVPNAANGRFHTFLTIGVRLTR